MPCHDGQPAQEIPGWRLWVSATGRHWALRRDVLTATQIAAGARPLLWAEDSTGLAALLSAQDGLTAAALSDLERHPGACRILRVHGSCGAGGRMAGGRPDAGVRSRCRGQVYISDPGVVSSLPVSSHVVRPERIPGQPP